MTDKQLKSNCLLLANAQYQKARNIEDERIRDGAIKAWAHIIELIETSY